LNGYRGSGFARANAPPRTVAAAAAQKTISIPNAAAIGPDAAGPTNMSISAATIRRSQLVGSRAVHSENTLDRFDHSEMPVDVRYVAEHSITHL